MGFGSRSMGRQPGEYGGAVGCTGDFAPGTDGRKQYTYLISTLEMTVFLIGLIGVAHRKDLLIYVLASFRPPSRGLFRRWGLRR